MERKCGTRGGEEDIIPAERETRCFTITGLDSSLDDLENLLRDIERAGEQSVFLAVCVLIDGRAGPPVRINMLGSWIDTAVNCDV